MTKRRVLFFFTPLTFQKEMFLLNGKLPLPVLKERLQFALIELLLINDFLKNGAGCKL
jgi:hypothetical protein